MNDTGSSQASELDSYHRDVDPSLGAGLGGFIVAHQPPVAHQPTEGPLHDPATGQYVEALGGVDYWHHWPSELRGNDYGWVPLSEFNQPPNPDVVGLNPAFSLQQPWAPGQIIINIPVDWKIGDNGPTNSMTGWNQVISISGNGTVTVTKYGKTVTRDTNNVVDPSL